MKEWSGMFLLFICLLKGCVSLPDILYEGRNFVAEGENFTLTCVKSSYGIPKWTRNGVAAHPPEYGVVEHNLTDHRIRIELRVVSAEWWHRGEYKCDTLHGKSHRVEVVPSRESDKEILTQSRVQLRLNRTLKLVCDQEENDVFPSNWYKDGRRILESEEDPRIQMEGRTLTISKSTEQDAGEYMCVIESLGLSYPYADHLRTRIKVTYAARVEAFPPQMRPIFNRTLKAECKVQGFPAPRVAWFVDGIPLDEYSQNDTRFGAEDNAEGFPGSVFVIKDVQFEDDHEITCVAENLEGSAQTSTQLAVRANAITTNEEIPGKGIILTPGHDLVLQCNNTDASAGVSWTKDGKLLNSSDARVEFFSLNNSLVIKNTVENDCGNYTCSVGGNEAIITVRSLVKIAPLDNSRNVVQNQNIVLICNVTQGIPAPTLTWFKDEVLLNMSDSRITRKKDETRGIEDTELIIGDAQFEDRATYRCFADNGYSQANATILVRVKDKYAALWPFLGICAEVAVLCTIIFIYEKRRQKPDFDESETEHNTENKSVPDQDDKNRDVRQRK